MKRKWKEITTWGVAVLCSLLLMAAPFVHADVELDSDGNGYIDVTIGGTNSGVLGDIYDIGIEAALTISATSAYGSTFLASGVTPFDATYTLPSAVTGMLVFFVNTRSGQTAIVTPGSGETIYGFAANDSTYTITDGGFIGLKAVSGSLWVTVAGGVDWYGPL